MTTALTDAPTTELLSAGNLIDRLGAASVDDLRVLLGRLEDAERITKAVLRERLSLARRNAGWKAREQLTESR